MVEAIIGSVIAVIATGALALMTEVFNASQSGIENKQLSAYEAEVLKVVISAHGQDSELLKNKELLEDWLAKKWRDGGS